MLASEGRLDLFFSVSFQGLGWVGGGGVGEAGRSFFFFSAYTGIPAQGSGICPPPPPLLPLAFPQVSKAPLEDAVKDGPPRELLVPGRSAKRHLDFTASVDARNV